MKNNSLSINPQMQEYGGLRMNEVNFLKFCLYNKLIMKRDYIIGSVVTNYHLDILAKKFVEGRPTVSLSQLHYYIIQKWAYRNYIIDYKESEYYSWFDYEWIWKNPHNTNTYNKIYEEIEELVHTKDITIDMVMRFYNPKEPADILPFYKTVYPDLTVNLLGRKILNRFACMVYMGIKNNTFTLPLSQQRYRAYDYQFYVSNELALKDKPKPELPAIRGFERYCTSEYLPVTGKVVIKNPPINLQKSLDITDAADNVVKLINTEGPTPIITSEMHEGKPNDLYCNDTTISKETFQKVIEKFREMAHNPDSLKPTIMIDQNWPTNDYDPSNYGKFDVGESHIYDRPIPSVDLMLSFHSINENPGESLKDLNIKLIKGRRPKPEINPQLWEFGGMKRLEYLFFRYCIQRWVFHAFTWLTISVYDLADDYIKIYPRNNKKQLLYYIQKWQKLKIISYNPYPFSLIGDGVNSCMIQHYRNIWINVVGYNPDMP